MIMSYQTLNPSTEEALQTYTEVPWDGLAGPLEKSRRAFDAWKGTSVGEKSRLLLDLAKQLRKGMSRYASLITREMGKPITQAEAEIEKCAWVAEHFAKNGEGYLRPVSVSTEAKKSYVRFDPLGAVLGVMPWNFPFWQVFRFAVPALTAGNAILLKPALNVSGCGIEAENILKEAGFPDGLFQTLLISHSTASELIASDFVQAVSLTASSRAGSEIASQAGRALKKTVLELGGSDPFIVLDDADLEKAIPAAVSARMGNTGQSCNAGKRFIVTEKIYKAFEAGFAEGIGRQKVGDPMERATEIGPLAREDLLQNLMEQVDRSVSQGAKILIGGRRMDRKGYFYLPTLLSEVKPGMTAFEEELFGPVAALIRAKDEEEALALANRSSYGLGASLWTKNLELAERLASRLEAGVVYINNIVRSDPRLPFGGVKQSGYGRELASFGLQEFTNVKTVWVA
jgi:succinate-semialdehyde dehydrogenase/glutarate-semialdehyde dehydrogenase